MDQPPNIAAGASVMLSGRKLFSAKEATRSLVLVRRIVADVIDEYPHLLELQEMLEDVQRYGPVERIQQLQASVGRSVGRLQDCICELDELGVELRDFTRGVVDFPAERDGREVRLCWQYGEESVRYWHEAGQGLADRKLIGEFLRVE